MLPAVRPITSPDQERVQLASLLASPLLAHDLSVGAQQNLSSTPQSVSKSGRATLLQRPTKIVG
jgi:hypothetical protein